MLRLGILLIIGGVLIRFISPIASPLDWILMALGVVIVIFALLTKRK
jgi:hypothetical protein